MPLFKCSECGCVENTAVSNYWSDFRSKPPLGNDGFLYEPELLAKGSFDSMIKSGLQIVGDA